MRAIAVCGLAAMLAGRTAAQDPPNVAFDLRDDLTTSHGADTRRIVWVDTDSDGQVGIDDPAAIQGIALTNAVRATSL